MAISPPFGSAPVLSLVSSSGYNSALAKLAKYPQYAGLNVMLVDLTGQPKKPIGLGTTGDSSLNRPWSLLGYGVMTVPAGAGPAGMPLGLQIIDPQPGAPLLFAAAFAAETAFAATQSKE